MMISDALLEFEGHADTLTLERAVFVRRLSGWREGRRLLIGRFSWDAGDRLVASEQEGLLYTHAYDENGNEVACYALDPQGQTVSREIRETDTAGRLIRRVLKTVEPPEEQQWTYEYDKTGRIRSERQGNRLRVEKRNARGQLEQVYLYVGEKPGLITDYTYNPEGKLTRTTTHDVSGTVHRSRSLEWDERGRLSAEILRDGSGRALRDERYAYGASYENRWLERVTWVRGGKKGKKRHPSEVFYRSFTLSGENTADTSPESSGEPSENQQTLAFANGIYQGSVRDGKAEGRGVFRYNNESCYEGEFRDGLPHGAGVLTWKDGRRMEGNFQKGKMEGPGSCSWADGSHYRGEFRDGKMDGRGTFVWENGTRFDGLFSRGRRTDQGVWEHVNKEENLQ